MNNIDKILFVPLMIVIVLAIAPFFLLASVGVFMWEQKKEV